MNHINKKLVIAPNLNIRWSGVTSTIFALLPIQAKSIDIVSFGFNIPINISSISLYKLFKIRKDREIIWHARRNIEMLFGILIKFIFKMNIKLIFTSAAQRNHSKYTKWLIRKMDKVIATSEKASRYLEVPHDVIMHGVDTKKFIPSTNKNKIKEELNLPKGTLIGCFGRIRYQKGIDIFVKSMIDVCKSNSDVYGLISGKITNDNKKYFYNLKKIILNENLGKRIIFLGEQPSHNLPLLFRCLDIYIAPQRWEGFGLTPLEAMSSGIPVIATTAGLFQEMITPNQNGFIVELEDTDSITMHINNILDKRSLLEEMSYNARLRVLEDFNINTEAEKLIRVYNDIGN